MRRLLLLVSAVVLLAVLAVAALPVVGGFFLAAGSCDEEEREVYAEFSQYGGIEKEPEASSVSGGCAVFYDTRSSQERVAGYYAEQLEAHGWEVEETVHETTVLEEKKRTFEEVEIMARRGDFFYNVLFESHAYYDPPRPGVHVAVHLSEKE